MVESQAHSMMGLAGRKILITGAAQGIGRATAIRLAKLGAKVVPADVQDCSDTAAACNGAEPISIDLTDRERVEAIIDSLDIDDAPLYGVVNCAGILMRRQIEETTKEEVELQTAVNQTSVFFLARKAIGKMQQRKEGRIVLYTSQAAFTGGFNGSIPYSMNKAAVTAMVKSLARQGAPYGVTVNAVAPGACDTSMLRSGMSQEDLNKFESTIPIGRFAHVDELAGPTAFLLSDWASYVTGTTMHVNGGQLMV